uniref:Uncharacterized protein n=1 Tax=Rhodosorus marinus TaxID=101924 RepID=A0A7S0BQ01_9RHOD|mmetsp:Transcript_4228/g.6005  ORF Transcript_4228/g.6005 Transcript_4228/m.6005 type:complete len:102 (+) Transcript_4228:427-732(+)
MSMLGECSDSKTAQFDAMPEKPLCIDDQIWGFVAGMRWFRKLAGCRVLDQPQNSKITMGCWPADGFRWPNSEMDFGTAQLWTAVQFCEMGYPSDAFSGGPS